jgi:hypothetical protein
MPTTTTTPWSRTPPKSDESSWYSDRGYEWTPRGWLPSSSDFNWGFRSGSNLTDEPYPDRALPSWFPSSGSITSELEQQYRTTPSAFSTAGYRQAVENAIGGISATAKSGASNAAAEYANRVLQQGGSAAGAGLIKAQGLIKGQAATSDIKLKAAQYEIEQREKAASQAAQIAAQLGDLRNNYLSTLAGYASKEDQIAAELDIAGMNRKASGAGDASRIGGLTYSYGTGPGGAGGSDFQSIQQAENYFQRHQNQMTPYGWSGDWGG